MLPFGGHAAVIGLTGAPGVGKSTTTSAFVTSLRELGKRVGVLAVDPSSPFSGGALLGDRVRMQDHALDPRRLHPLDGLAGPPRRAVLVDAAGAAGARRRGLRRGRRRDRRGRAERGRGRRSRRHHGGAAGAGDGRRDPGRQGGHPRDRRRLRRQQGRPRRRRPHGARAAQHAGAGGASGAERLATADRQDRRVARARASTSSSRRSRSTRAGSSRAASCSAAATGARPTRSRRSRSPSCGSGWATREAGVPSRSSPAQVVAGEIDAYVAADRLVEGVTTG